jgi:cytochrome c2
MNALKENSIRFFLALAAVFTFPILASGQQMESHIGKLTGHSGAGKELYFRYCWGCHGFRGDGNGENAAYMNPTPRNFVSASFKCRSTVTGTLPTDEDLYNSIGRGFNTTKMPSWITLTNQNRADLVAFIKTFSPRWKTEMAGVPIVIPAEPKLTVESIKHGQKLFQKLECWKCHRQQRSADPSIQLFRRFAVQVWDLEPGSLQDFHDGRGWHANALVC